MTTLGVIPAAGKGSRWGGFYKELLPCGEGNWLIDNTINTMIYGGADKILVITTPEKVSTHATHLDGKFQKELFFALQFGKNDIYSAIETSLPHAGDINYFAMPDTYIDYNTFAVNLNWADLYLGTFLTDTPERFGVIHEGRVVNKEHLTDKSTYEAWGVLIWTKNVADFWLHINPKDYTDAINKAMEIFTWDRFPLAYYYDMASWKDYRRLLEWIK